MRRFIDALRDFAKGFAATSTSVLEAELKEMENAFTVILLGALAGFPAPPSFIGLSLLPSLEREIKVMLSRSGNLDDVFADWFSTLDFG
ncbi:MAG: hypothetical protein D6713_04580 [Deltaproteobacteria bacterium]|nr:MAG: hypothetical protein D6713_04580 [Deltaproteobacteria bacterium]